jgi:hypothetical protein
MAKFTDNQRESAKVAAMTAYQNTLIESYLFGATDEERENMKKAFNDDTKAGAFLLIRGTDSKVNENGELTTTDKDGNVEVWKGAYVFTSLTWKVDKETGKVTETRNYFRAPIEVNTWVRCERVVNSWIDYAERKYQDVLDTITKRREKVEKDCKTLMAAAVALLEFTDTIPEKFVEKYRETYREGVRYGYAFDDEIVSAFTESDGK